MALTQESIVASFPHQVIPRQIGQPTYATISEVHTKLKANAASIPSTLGGGMNGLLGLMLGPATYQAFTGRMFAAPQDPGATPNIPANTTVANTNRLVHQHAADLKTYQEYTRTDNTLKQQILNAYDDIYLRDLRNRHTGYATTSALRLIHIPTPTPSGIATVLVAPPPILFCKVASD